MNSDSSKIRIRNDLKFHSIQHEGENLFLVEDPLGLIPGQLILTQFAAALMALMDGSQTLEDLVQIIHQSTHKKIPQDVIRRHIDEIAECGILEDEKYFETKQSLLDEFSRMDTLNPTHAGVTYPADADELRTWLDQLLENSQPFSPEPPRLIIAPHIDFRVNTTTYGKAYSQLIGHRYDRVVLLGTGHSIHDGIYCPTRKDLSSPLGITSTDKKAVHELMIRGDGIVSRDDYAHSGEHALEFQIIFLQHLLGTKEFEVIPILCGSLSSFLGRAQRSEFIERAKEFLGTLEEIIHQPDRKTLVVGGVDFSHVGIRFSHRQPALAMLEETRKHDRNLIDAFSHWDADEFWQIEAESQGSFNVCGFSTLATFLEVLGPCKAHCLDYSVWDDSPTDSAVTFAALVAR